MAQIEDANMTTKFAQLHHTQTPSKPRSGWELHSIKGHRNAVHEGAASFAKVKTQNGRE